ncbi:replication initiation protein [Limibacter armeniacum]|uniref:replication initiation protein n=1 Tax=Limibacter armeniacum TaxID=466084 RepID=UPI002FE5D322
MKYNIVKKERRRRRISKSNALINAKDKVTLSALEQKMVLFAITELDGSQPALPLSVSFQDFFGKKRLTSNHYRDIRKACKSLASAAIAFEEEDEAGNFLKGEYVPLFSRIRAEAEEGTFTFEFNQVIVPHITSLKRSFTSYHYIDVEHMKSGFSIRIYELLMQGVDKYKSREFSVEELKSLLGIINSSTYDRFSNFRKVVLDRACTEISEKSGIDVTWEVSRKKGKKVTHITFFMNRKEAISNTQELKESSPIAVDENLKKQIEGMRALNLSDEQIMAAIGLDAIPDFASKPKANNIPVSKSGSVQGSLFNNSDETALKGNRSLLEKRRRLIQILVEYGLTQQQSRTVMQKVGVSKESGIWLLLNEFKMGVKDGKITSPASYLIKLLNSKYQVGL